MLPKNGITPVSEPFSTSLASTEEVKKEVELEEVKGRIPSKNFASQNSDIASVAPKLLAWCSWKNNEIDIVELETKRNYANIAGAKISNTEFSWSHVKEIPNTNLLVSLHHNEDKAAKLEIFDISKKDRTNIICSFEEVKGVTGKGDVTYNPRRSVLGAISVTGKIAYHLYSINTSKAAAIVKLNRKSSWHPHYSSKNGNYITGFDFNPIGELVTTIDRYGICLISDMNTNNSPLLY